MAKQRELSPRDLRVLNGKMIVDSWYYPENSDTVLLFSDESKLIINTDSMDAVTFFLEEK